MTSWEVGGTLISVKGGGVEKHLGEEIGPHHMKAGES